ncbi:cupin domain-containing protein [Salinactinospora qingdaonensis]|uniref:Cupin domain-containing protein n=1 Tax=Salinactinospora qingdaonensis TaxID=702744 RepID=A0ABP7G7F7_9ACTN
MTDQKQPAPAPRKVNLSAAFAGFSDTWSPKVAGDINDMQLKLVKLTGAFVWHHHEAEDELFLVVNGRMRMCLRDGDVTVLPGEFIIIPRGVEHCPVAEEDCEVVLLEPTTTSNTGNVREARTVDKPERI